jgi:hypothetical protein
MFKCPYFYVYHHEGQCRCLQDSCSCQGNSDVCENILGRRAYEDDLWEEGALGRLRVIWNKLLRNLW